MEGSSPKMVRLKEFGVWSEQTSSSGKRYYYNRESEISQWEKPSEWKEHEKSLTTKQGSLKATKISAPAAKPLPQQQLATFKPLNNTPNNSDLANHSTTNNPSTSSNRQQHALSSNAKVSSNAPATSTSSCSSQYQNKSNGSLKRTREEDRHHHKHQQGSSITPTNNSNSTSAVPSKISRSSNNGSAAQASSSSVTSSKQPNSRPFSSTFSTPKFTNQPSQLPQTTNETVSQGNRTPIVAAHPQNVACTPEITPKTSTNSFGKSLATPTSAAATVSQTAVADLKEAVSVPVVNYLKKEEQVVVGPVFREEKYLKFYRAELTAHRRNWSSEGYASEARKYAERNCKQSANLALVDNDINSVRSLLKTAEVRCLLLNQKLQFVREQICSLEANSHSM